MLEIGSGTGQHGVFFSSQLPDVVWQCSERSEYLDELVAWLKEASLDNLPMPLELDVTHYDWDSTKYQVVFSANTLHIMHWPAVTIFLTNVREALTPSGKFIVYGPFRYGGNYTSDSNAQFDRSLQLRDPKSGIRDFEKVDHILKKAGFTLVSDQSVPTNNQLILWRLSR